MPAVHASGEGMEEKGYYVSSVIMSLSNYAKWSDKTCEMTLGYRKSNHNTLLALSLTSITVVCMCVCTTHSVCKQVKAQCTCVCVAS